MTRLYRFAGDNPELFGGTAIRVIDDRVLLDVGDNPGPIEHQIYQAEGWGLLRVGATVADLPVQMTRELERAVAALTDISSPREYAQLISDLRAADVAAKSA